MRDATITKALRAARSEREMRKPSRLQRPIAAEPPMQILRSDRTTSGPLDDAWEYQLDLWQRSVLFVDTLRERANKHARA